MTLARNCLMLLIALTLVAGCNKREVAKTKSSKETKAEVAEAPAPLPADSPEVIAEMEKTNGVAVKKSGDHVVELDLTELRPDAAEDQANEFAWVAGLPALTTIKAKGPGVSLEAVQKLKDHPNLAVIEFDNATQVTDQAMKTVAALPKLADVDLIKSDITNESLKLLADSDTIRRIRIARTKVTDEGIAHLEKAKQLELLDLLECSLLTNECATSVGKLTNLRNVRLPSAVDNDGLKHVQNLKGLVALGLQYCRVGTEGLRYLEGLNEIKEMNLYGASNVNDEAIGLLAKFPKLTKLNLRETSVRGEDVAGFAEMKELRELDLSESPVQSDAMVHIIGLPKLESLNLWNTQVTADALAGLKGKTTLKRLNLQGLGDTIDDDFLDIVATMPNLELLVLQDTGVSDEGMSKLHGLKKLKLLVIKGTYVLEKSTFNELKKQLPAAKIDW